MRNYKKRTITTNKYENLQRNVQKKVLSAKTNDDKTEK